MYEIFYTNGIPNPNVVPFEGLMLPLSPQVWVLNMKKALAHKKDRDHKDIAGLEQIIETKANTRKTNH